MFRRSEKSRYLASARAYKEIQDRFNAAMASGTSLEDVRDDVWDLQMKLVMELARDAPSTAVAGPLQSAARLSFQIECSTGVDWVRTTTSGLAFAAACASAEAFFGRRGEPMPRDLLGEMRGVAMLAAYAGHRCGAPLVGVMVAEAITSLSLGDRMVARELTATVEDEGPEALQQLLDALVQQPDVPFRQAGRAAKRAKESGLGMPEIMQQTFERDWLAREAPAGKQGLVTSPFAVASVRAAASSGRTLVYLAPGPRSGAALRINPPDAQREMCESVELPDLDIDAVRSQVQRIREAYAGAQSGSIGRKALARVIRSVLDGVASAFWAPLLSTWPDLRDARIALVPLGHSALLPLYTSPVDGTPACGLLDVTVVPSGRALFLASTWPEPADRNVFVAADPWYGAGEIPRTVPEAREVAAAHGVEPRLSREPGEAVPGDRARSDGDPLRTFRGAGAGTGPTGSDRVPDDVVRRLSEASLIHLACHGDLQSDEPLTSSLLLDDRLPLSSLLERDLRPGATVVLSACELGSIAGDLPDEQLGFPAALLAMGARSVIGALWPVPDEDDTVDLMVDTHRGLSNASATLALGRAIRRSHELGVPASVWASFTHFGA
ncbi:CHAT domain-containing protein [Streptomyces sp. NBC_01167]|uniref:CHAT domain-containing protein n=1 Tax=Streptomyces sp. NBC_01167 TaxID=2903756 RepID=UPI00386569D0|nr:CHAT domain-containing protein [Streptomyces sp. NBC_01167]